MTTNIVRFYSVREINHDLNKFKKLSLSLFDSATDMNDNFIMLSVMCRAHEMAKTSILGQAAYNIKGSHLGECGVELSCVGDFPEHLIQEIIKKYGCVVESIRLSCDVEQRTVWMFDGRKALDEESNVEYDTEDARTRAIQVTNYGLGDYIKSETHYANPNYKSKSIHDIVSDEFHESIINCDLIKSLTEGK